MSESAPSKKGTALQAITMAIIAIASRDTVNTEHLYCIMILAGIVVVYIAAQTVLEWKK